MLRCSGKKGGSEGVSGQLGIWNVARFQLRALSHHGLMEEAVPLRTRRVALSDSPRVSVLPSGSWPRHIPWEQLPVVRVGRHWEEQRERTGFLTPLFCRESSV